METNDELKEIYFKSRTCFYDIGVLFDDIIKIEDFDIDNTLIMTDHTKIFWFMIFHKTLRCKTIANWIR